MSEHTMRRLQNIKDKQSMFGSEYQNSKREHGKAG